MLRRTLTKRFHEIMEADGFNVLDFTFSEHTEPGLPWEDFVFRYRYEPFFFRFRLMKDQRSSVGIALDLNPGTALGDESFEVEVLDDVFRHFDQWLNRIREELEDTPLAREIEKQRAQIDTLVEEMEGLRDEMFTRAEGVKVEAFVRELDATLATFSEKAEAEKAAMRDEMTIEIERLRQELEGLRSEIQTSSKKQWFTKLIARIFRLAKNPVVQKLALEVAKRGMDHLGLPEHKGD